jgi:hypothetical protein
VLNHLLFEVQLQNRRDYPLNKKQIILLYTFLHKAEKNQCKLVYLLLLKIYSDGNCLAELCDKASQELLIEQFVAYYCFILFMVSVPLV